MKIVKLRFGPEPYKHPPTPSTQTFFWLLRGLDKSDEPRMGWYDSNMVRGGSDFKVDIKRDYRWDVRE